MTTISFKNSVNICFDGINRLTATSVPSGKVPLQIIKSKAHQNQVMYILLWKIGVNKLLGGWVHLEGVLNNVK